MAEDLRNVYDFACPDIDGNMIDFKRYMGKVLLIVNTCSKGDSYEKVRQLAGIQRQFAGRNFEVLAFPCNQFMGRERARPEEIRDFYIIRERVPFTVFQKVKVNGHNKSPLFQWLKRKAPGHHGKRINGNFTKFLVAPDGVTVKRYGSHHEFYDISVDIERLVCQSEGITPPPMIGAASPPQIMNPRFNEQNPQNILIQQSNVQTYASQMGTATITSQQVYSDTKPQAMEEIITQEEVAPTPIQ